MESARKEPGGCALATITKRGRRDQRDVSPIAEAAAEPTCITAGPISPIELRAQPDA